MKACGLDQALGAGEIPLSIPALVSGYEALKGPKDISGFEGDTVSLQCTYEEKRREHTKYWCSQGGILLSRCSGTIYTRGEERVTRDRVSIHDDPQRLFFTVTIRDLTLQDAGKYWCGIDRLGKDEAFSVSLTVFPGKGRSPSTPGACCPPSPAPSFQTLTATASLTPKVKAWQTRPPDWPTQPPELTSSDLRPTVTTAKPGKTGVQARVFTGPTPPPPGSPGSSPHTATSPHAGSSRPIIWLPTTVPQDVPSSSSSKSMGSIPTARMLAPVLVLLSLLMAAGLIALGSHIIPWGKKALLTTETQGKEKVYLPTSPLEKGRTTEDAMISLAAPPDPLAGPSTEIQYLSQTTGEEAAHSQDAEEDMAEASPLQTSAEELGFSEFIAV